MKDFTIDELNDPKNRAQHILEMPPSIRGEVLNQFEFMARGSRGEITDGVHLRDRYYKYFNDDWFKAVLTEVRRLAKRQ
jgi:hypothetical protein